MSDDALTFELDGPDVHPDKVDALLLLRLAAQYFHLFARAADVKRTPVSLRGIEIVDKCVAVRTRPSNAQAAAILAGVVAAWVQGDEEPPAGAETATNQFRSELRRLPEKYSAKVHAGKRVRPLVPPAENGGARPWETVDLRVTPIRVGGEDPVVKFRADTESADFTLRVSQSDARRLGAALYSEVDIVAQIARAPDGSITEGRVEAVLAVEGDEDPSAAWRTWFDANARADWRNVDDVLAELGRRDD